jgi:hypothetical protein
MQAQQYQAPPTDPAITALADKSKQDNIEALQQTAAIDTARINAVYGTRVAMSGIPQAPGVR